MHPLIIICKILRECGVQREDIVSVDGADDDDNDNINLRPEGASETNCLRPPEGYRDMLS